MKKGRLGLEAPNPALQRTAGAFGPSDLRCRPGPAAAELGVRLFTPVSAPVKKHQRPAQDFRVTSVAWELDNEARHRQAGFDPVGREVVLRRFFQFADFLQRHGMTTRQIVGTLDEVSEAAELRNSDLTDEGFHFARRCHGKWLNRMFRDQGGEKERRVLERWLVQFRDQ